MSLCYDFQKWIIVSLASVTITLIIGLSVVYGQSQSKYMNEDEVQIILGSCYQHADRPNPVQDLVDKGLVSSEFKGDTCASVKQGSEDAEATFLGQANNASFAYDECRQSKSENDKRTSEDWLECDLIIREYCDNPVSARRIYFTCADTALPIPEPEPEQSKDEDTKE